MSQSPNRFHAAASFRVVLRRFLRASEEQARAAGITPQQYLLLLQVSAADTGTVTVGELVDKLALTQSAVTELVQRAEDAGLVLRTTSQLDRRVVDVSATPLGAGRLAQVHDALGPERAGLRDVLDALEDR